MKKLLLLTAVCTLIACADSTPSLPPTLTYITPLDQQRSITLSDGTTTILNADTQVEVIYGSEVRLIKVVRGEVYFKVADGDPRPFQVQAAAGAVTTNGNSVSAFETSIKEPAHLTVAVESGRVVVSTQEQQQQLQQLQQLTIANDKQLGNVKILEELDSTWRDGWLEYQDTPLGEIIEQLNQYYNGVLRLKADQEAELSELRVSARFYVPNIQKVTRLLALSMRLKTSTEDGFITFYRPVEKENQESVHR